MNNKSILWITVFVTAVLMILSGEKDYWFHILSLVLLAFSSSVYVRFDIHHPLCLYISMVTLYSVGYAILYSFDFSTVVTRYGYNKATLVYLWFSIVLMIVLLPKKRVNFRKCPDKLKYIGNYSITRKITTILSLLTFIGIFYIKITGFEGKGDIYENGGFAINLLAKIIYFNLLFYTYHMYLSLLNGIKVDKKWFLINFGSIALFGLVTGERDYFFHVLLTTFLIYYSLGKIKKKMLPVYGFAGILLIVLSKVFKYAFLGGSSGEGAEFGMQGLFLQFIDGEFSSVGRNMQVLVSEGYENYFGGTSLLIDLLRVFYDFGFSSQRWFNETVLYYISTGYGFTLVGEGYINGGIFGIILVVSISTLLLRYLYIKTQASFIYIVIYIYMLPQFIYATRADITNIMSPLLKHAILGIVLLNLLSKFLTKKNKYDEDFNSHRV